MKNEIVSANFQKSIYMIDGGHDIGNTNSRKILEIIADRFNDKENPV